MKNTRFILAIAMFALIGSCKKPDTTPSVVSTYPTYSSMEIIYKSLEVKPKYVTVNGAAGGTFYGTSGTRYVIPPNCLQDASGNPVTTNVQFEVAEYLKKGDMIFSKMLPVSNGQPLLSGGQLSIAATLSGQPIFLKTGGCKVSIMIPPDKDIVSGMQFFAGREVTNPTDSRVNWQRNDTFGFSSIIYNGDTVNILSDSFRYINADKFMSFGITKPFKITYAVSGGVMVSDQSLIKGFVLIDNYKSVYPMGNHLDYVLTESNLPDVAKHFAVFGMINNRFYAGVIAAPQGSTVQNYTVTISEADPAAFKAQLNNLTK